MNIIVFALVVTGVIFLIYQLGKRWNHATDSDAHQGEAHPRLEDESHQFADKSPLLADDGIPRLTQQPEMDPKTIEMVTSSPTNAADQSRCPACGAIITAKDERCPSCEISFVTDGISLVTDGFQKWTPRTVGPADGIYVPSAKFRQRSAND